MRPAQRASQIIDKMKDEFLAEAEELLDEINADLVVLEAQGDHPGSDLVFKVLRAAHSLKGSSGMFGLDDLSQASHSLEGMLEDVHEGRVEDTENLIGASLDQIEVMRYFLREASGRVSDGVALGEGASECPDEAPEEGAAPGGAHAELETAGDEADANRPAEPESCDPVAPQANRFLRIDLGDLDQALNQVGDLLLGVKQLRDLQKSARLSGERRSSFREQTMAARMIQRRLGELRDCLLGMRMVPLGRVFNRLLPAVRSVNRETGKTAALCISGGDTRLDKAMAEALTDPLVHLIRNAIDHGIEAAPDRKAAGKPPEGRVSLSARREGPEVVIEVADDGGGVDLDSVLKKARGRGLLREDCSPTERQILECLFSSGLSTANSVSSISGRGVGMDVVRTNIIRLSGSVGIATQPGRGTTVTIRVPPTLSTVDGLLVETAGQVVVLPFYSVEEVVRISEQDRLQAVSERRVVLREQSIRTVSLARLLGLTGGSSREGFGVTVGRGSEMLTILVDRLGERSEVLVKPLGPRLDSLRFLSGVAELADERVALVLDVSSILEGMAVADGLSK
jgi:two-component system chemotaxis sensor kinase CheA